MQESHALVPCSTSSSRSSTSTGTCNRGRRRRQQFAACAAVAWPAQHAPPEGGHNQQLSSADFLAGLQLVQAAPRCQVLPLAWLMHRPAQLQQQHQQQRVQAEAAGGASQPAAGAAGLFPLFAVAELPQGAQQPFSSISTASRRAAEQQHQRQQQQQQQQQPQDRNKLRTRGHHEQPASLPSTLCVEADGGGRQRVYCARSGVDKKSGRPWEGFDMVDDPQTHQGRLLGLVRSYLLPQGFPDSVAPQYASYMGWRGVQYFFGGAMSVFTTKCLLTSLGVAGRHSGEAAAAINWVLKDGAGRLGRFLFARWGRELDCELKQFRLAGDLLMEAGAALELSTIMAPHAFLPLACSANLAKNLAAVAASSTRAPIYRTFALQNNLADITAKGESVANLADILGTLAGILLSKWRLPMVPTFVALSCGYLLASRREVDSVELPYLNRARLAFSATHFLATGVVPGVPEANHKEPLLPWGRYHQGRVVLGSRVEAACATPGDLGHAAQLYKHEKFVVCYRHDTKKVHVLLRQGAGPTDCLKAAFSAHVFLHMLDEEQKQQSQKQPAAAGGGSGAAGTTAAAPSAAPVGAGKLGAPAAPDAAAAAAGSGSSAAQRRWFGLRGPKQQGPDSAAAAAQQQQQPAPPPLTGAALVRETWHKLAVALPWGQDPGGDYYRRLLERSKCAVDSLYADFSRQAERQGWKLAATMLNPKETRLLRLTPLAAGS